LLACLLAISLISKVDVMKALTFLHKTNVVGTLNMLGLAKRIGARFLLTSTSEVYGDPLQHPQKEEYWGNVNPIGVHTTHYPLKPSCSSTVVYALV
jgi:nucleoside-diphosphate-sugar epimerase